MHANRGPAAWRNITLALLTDLRLSGPVLRCPCCLQPRSSRVNKYSSGSRSAVSTVYCKRRAMAVDVPLQTSLFLNTSCHTSESSPSLPRTRCRAWPSNGWLKLHVVCRRIVTIDSANQDAADVPSTTCRRSVTCLEHPRISSCTPGTRHGTDAVMQ